MPDSSMNRKWNITNPNQGPRTRVLCVCSAGLLRSPTLANVLAQEPWNFNTRAVGTEEEFALISPDEIMIDWADEIVCVDAGVARRLMQKFPEMLTDDDLVVLRIPDQYQFMEPELVKEVKRQVSENPRLTPA